MNEKILQTLEYEKVKALFGPYLATAQGQRELTDLQPSADRTKIEAAFDELTDFVAVSQESGSLQLSATTDVSEILKRLELAANLSAPEFVALKKLVSVVMTVRAYFDSVENTEFPYLHELTEKLSDLSSLARKLDIFDDAGNLLDTASDTLFGLRKSIKRNEASVRKVLQDLLSKNASALSEPLITIRNDRQVLPVRAASKNRVAGVVHDISASGQTLYIEPNSAVSLNNAISQARIEEKNEIARLFAELSAALQADVPDLRQSAWVLGKIDMIQAKTTFLAREAATIPEIRADKNIQLLAARHPLISKEKAVTNDILFDEDLNTIVITGPNTGGKTITLKTVGLLTLMAQSGLPITAKSGSQIAIFDAIFADIGDEQSIEASLSTFSSHMTAIVDILTKANAKSLVLFDELGAGTDPKEGAALAIAILENLRQKNVKTLATTHYPELKVYGLETDTVLNASMVFDIETMQPTYKLSLGVPGSSNALEISRRLGLSAEIIAAADDLLTDEEHDLNAMILRLEETTRLADEKLQQAEALQYEASKKEAALENRTNALIRNKDQLEAAANRDAAEIVTKAREEVQAILQQLNEKMQLKPHEVISAMAELDALAPDLSQNKVLKKAKAQRGLSAGAEVMVTSYGQHGRLERLLKDGRWEVSMGNITAKLNESEFELLQSAPEPKAKSRHITRSAASSIKAQLDLRGTRYEAAALELDSYIDQALLANLNQITIVHGIGTGVIRDMVQEKLAKNKHIKSFSYAPMNAGGSGATIAILK